MPPAQAEHELRGQTALHRPRLSRPIRLAIDERLIRSGETTVFDYGCGRGGDLGRLTDAGVDCAGWDPHHRPEAPLRTSDVVNLGYVVNVIEDRAERDATLRGAWRLARELLMVSARLATESRDLGGIPFRDGLRTATGSFQKLYDQAELRAWIDTTLGVRSTAAAPGVFVVFRHAAHEQEWLLRRLRRVRREAPVSRELLAQHAQLVAPLIEFVAERGRLPRTLELPNAPDVEREFGTLRNAFATVRRVTGTEPWDRVRDNRSKDLLVFLALARFGKRPRLKDLPEAVGYDIRALFGSYQAACDQADRLLFALSDQRRIVAAAATPAAGKRLPTALYVHSDALAVLPPILRVLEGAARHLIGEVENSTVVKLHLDRPAVSYLEYPGFDTVPHPALRSGYLVSLDRLSCDYRDYARHTNPPILHRKELLLAVDDARRSKFERLTRQEDRAGLYADPSRIGRRRAWDELVRSRGMRYVGHQLRKV